MRGLNLESRISNLEGLPPRPPGGAGALIPPGYEGGRPIQDSRFKILPQGGRGDVFEIRDSRFKIRSPNGFTLVELLVVICIIAILAGLVTVGLNAAMVNSRTAATETFLQSLSGACSQYATRWGDFPPTLLDDVGGRAPNGENNGIETLVACLASERRGGKLIAVDEDLYSNTDGDAASANVTGWFFGDNKLREITDKFGNVITYLHHRDFAKPRPQVLKYKVFEGGETVTIAPEKSGATSTWVGSGRFQLRSVGKDGKPGTGDDIRGGQ